MYLSLFKSCSDLCTAFGKSMTQVLHGKPAIIKMIHEGKHSRNKRAKTLAVWALKELKKLESWLVLCFVASTQF